MPVLPKTGRGMGKDPFVHRLRVASVPAMW